MNASNANSRAAGPQRFEPPPARLDVRVRTVATFICFGGALIFLVLVLGPLMALAHALGDRDRKVARRWVRRVYRGVLAWFCGSGLRFEPFDWSQAPESCIIVANHQSIMDILIMYFFPRDARVWAKDWPFNRPLLGWMMRLCGYLHVDSPDIMEQAGQVLKAGGSLYIFPEGTRSRDGRLGRFHDGAFALAVKTNTPIVAVAINGSGRCIPAGYVRVYRPNITVRVLGVLRSDPNAEKPQAALKAATVKLIAAALPPQNQA